jgi:integrase
MATVRKRGDTWQVQVRRKGLPNQTKSFHRRTDALQWARQMEVQADRNDLPMDRAVLEQVSLADLLVRYRDTVVPAKRGCEIETIIINAFLRSPLAKTKLCALRQEAFAAYRDKRTQTVKAATINRELGVIQHALDIARNEWSIPLRENPLRKVRRPRNALSRDRRLQEGEWDMLMAGCSKCRNMLVEPLICLAVETGMRRGELLSMRWSDIDYENRTLHIPVTKNGHPRTIPITDAALDIIEGLTDTKTDERIFPLTIESVKLAWRRLTDRTGLEDLHFHDLRHEAISRFFEMGLSMPEVALISGHRDARMLFRYTHLRAEDVGRKLQSIVTRSAL